MTGMNMRSGQNSWIALVLLCLFILPVVTSGTETLISTGTFNSNQLKPSIWGNWMVWEDQRNDPLGWGYSDIYAYNLMTGEERRLSAPDTYCYDPSVFNDQVAWFRIDDPFGSPTDHIIFYDLGPGIDQEVYSTTNTISSLSFSGGNIVWDENDGVSSDVLMYNISNNRLSSLTIDAPAGTDQVLPVVFGDIVVWQDSRSGTPDLYMNDTATITPSIITDNASNQMSPAISGKTVVWMDMQSGDWDIYSFDIPSQKITDISAYAGSNQVNPVNYDTQVIWLDDRFRSVAGEYDIIKKDLTSGVESSALNSPTASISSSNTPAIYGNRIVWVDDRAAAAGGLSDIYLYTGGGPASCPAASFTPLSASGPPPLTVQFADSSSGTPIHWNWNFGDGTTSTSRNPSHTFAASGTFLVNLTVGTAECRNMSIDHTISVGTPTASFIASPTEGIAPQNVIFDRNSTIGTVDTWAWDFGDAATSTDQDPAHIYTTDGTFDVLLTATNVFGPSTRSRDDYITIKHGIRTESTATLPGIAIALVGSDQQLTLDSTNFGTNSTSPDGWTLVTKPPSPAYGWQNITFLSSDASGFATTPPTTTGNIRRVFLKTNDITPTNFSAGFTATYGNGIIANYLMDLFSYPVGGNLNANVWEGAFPSDETAFLDITSHSGFTGSFIAYTMNTTRVTIPYPANATVNMSVKTSWVASYPGGVVEGRNHIYVIATGYDTSGKYVGTVLPARYLYSQGGYDFFAADVPPNAPYLSKFALSMLSGSGNIFQFISIGITEHFGPPSQPSDSGSESPGTGKSTGQGLTAQQNQPPINQPPPNPPAPTAKTADLYINEQGVVTQTTVLQAEDNLASIAIGQGVTALDANGNPLSSVSIETLGADHIAGMPSPGTASFAGLAYNFQPDGATFSPAVTVTFTLPNAQWSQQYSVREFDERTGTWIDLPTTYNPETGTVSASVSHFCCIALFSSTTQGKSAGPVAKATAAAPAVVPTPAASTPVGMLFNMTAFIGNLIARNVYLVLIILAIIAALYLRGRRGRLDRIRYKL